MSASKVATIVFLLLLTSCGLMTDMLQENADIQKSLVKNAQAEDVRMLGINNTNGTVSAAAEVVGDGASDKRAEASRLYNVLELEVPKFKKIDNFTLTFVNKGERTSYIFHDGKMSME